MARYVGIIIEYNKKTGFGRMNHNCYDYFIDKKEIEKVKITSKDIGLSFSFEIADHDTSAININRR